MSPTNAQNTAKGRDFQKIAADILSNHYNIGFKIEHKIKIGDPLKEHKFDLVSNDLGYVGESKNYSWTKGGNIPSAKMAHINEAVFYLHHILQEKKRFIVMRKDVNKKNESLAEYYYRVNRHLLDGVYIVEIDILTASVREFGI